jgi:hypothetical protein
MEIPGGSLSAYGGMALLLVCPHVFHEFSWLLPYGDPASFGGHMTGHLPPDV